MADEPRRVYIYPQDQLSNLQDQYSPPVEELPSLNWLQRLFSPTPQGAAPTQPNQPFGTLSAGPAVPLSTRIGDTFVQGLSSLGMDPYNARQLTSGLGGLLDWTGAPGAIDTVDAQRRNDTMGVVQGMAGMIPGAPAAKAAKKAATKVASELSPEAAEVIAQHAAANPRAVIGGNRPPPDVTGSLNPLDNVPVSFQGKQPHEFSPEDWQAFGQHYGVENLGPLSPMQTLTDAQGRQFSVPGGTEGNWTYSDLLHMKANPINPSEMDRELHKQMQQKLGRTMTPQDLSDADVWNGLVFGMTSPNNPLFPNQMAASRLRLRTPEMLDDLASMIPWRPGEVPTKEQRLLVSDNIASRYGLASAGKGGLGVRGSTDYTRVAEMAQMFKQNPNFFRKAPDEDWGQAVERISSQLPGLSMKTGSFGTVWQDPANAAISAIDRHMARELEQRGGIFASPAERTKWQNRGVALWNKRNPDNTVDGWSDLLTKGGSDGFVGEMLLDHVGNAATPKFRMAKGEINPNIPSHLANANWVREPGSVYKMGQAYRRALEINQRMADESGLNLFMSQWMEWDRIRNRFEPHENMFPGLSKTPAMSVEQLRAVDAAHKATGHKTYTKDEEARLPPTRPLAGSASQLGYLGLGAAAALPALRRDDTAD